MNLADAVILVPGPTVKHTQEERSKRVKRIWSFLRS